MTKLFLITYNEAVIPKDTLVELFDKLPGVLTWFSQMPGSFFIKTVDLYTAERISKLITDRTGTPTHLVVKIHLRTGEDYWGRLSKELWEHFKAD